jgi:Arabinose-binding domain of AraC transcription regulator, N-term
MSSNRFPGFRSIPSATGRVARLACTRLREQGKDVKTVLSKAGLGLEEIADPAARLEVRTQIKFLELAAEELQDDLLGFHLARSFDLRQIGLVYYVMASSERLADALRNAERYRRSRQDDRGRRLQRRADEPAAIYPKSRPAACLRGNRRNDDYSIGSNWQWTSNSETEALFGSIRAVSTSWAMSPGWLIS